MCSQSNIGDLFLFQSRIIVESIPCDVYHLTVGKNKNPTNPEDKKATLKMEGQRKAPDLTKAPPILFAAGGKIYYVDFSK